MKRLLPLSLAILSAQGFVHADEAKEELEIVVTASRIERPHEVASSQVKVITQQDLKRSGARTIADALARLASVHLADGNNNGDRVTLSMRGFGEANGGRNVLVLLNGQRLSNSLDIGETDLGIVRLADIDRIEVIEGSASVLYGDGAVGGIINMITRPNPRTLIVSAERGSFDREAYQVAHGHDFGTVRYQIGFDELHTDNYRDRNAQDRELSTLNSEWRWDSGKVQALIYRKRNELEMPGVLFKPQRDQNPKAAQYSNDFSKEQNEGWQLGLRQDLAPQLQLALDGSRRDEDIAGHLTQGGFGSPITQQRNQKQISPSLNGHWAMPAGNADWIAGSDLTKGEYHFRSSMGPQAGKQSTEAVFGQLSLPVTNDLRLTGGLRHARREEQLRDSFAYPTGININDGLSVQSWRIDYAPISTLMLSLRREDNYRFPMLDEQTNIMFGATPLRTQEGKSYELSARYRDHELDTTLSVYELQLHHEIDYDPTVFANVNLPDTKRQGGSFGIHRQVLPAWRLGIEHSQIDATFSAGSNNGKRIPLAPRHQTSFSSEMAFTEQLDWHLDIVNVGRRVAGGDYANQLDGLKAYTTANTILRWHDAHWSIEGGIRNLADKDYDATGNAAYTVFPAQATTYAPAPGREYRLAINYLW